MPRGTSPFIADRLRDLAWGCGFTALLAPPLAQGLAMNDITVRSRLGQPFDAIISVEASAGEVLTTSCFSVAQPATDGLPGIEGVRLFLDRTTGQLALRSAAPVLEPLNELTLRIHCDGTPSIERSFLVVLDPPAFYSEPTFARRDEEAQPARERPAARPERTRDVDRRAAAPSPERAPREPAAIAPEAAIAPGSHYVVQIGDTLSSVAARVAGRPAGSLWAIAEHIYEANPMAFLGDSPDRLIAGIAIAIPALEDDGALPIPSTARPYALAPVRDEEPAAAPVVAVAARSFAMSTAFSADSMEKLQLRRLGFMQAAQSASARLAARRPAIVDPLHQDPAALRPEAPITVRAGEEAAADPAGDTPESAAPMPATRASAAPATSEPASGFPAVWLLLAAGALLIGGLLTRQFLGRRHAEALRHARRGSGRERTIRLDHGILVDELPPGTPLMVDAPTQAVPVIAEMPDSAPASAETQLVASAAELSPEMAKLDMIDLASRADIESTMRIESPIEALDLELPEMAELPAAAPEPDTVPMDVVAAAGGPLADSRQFAVDTDLLALAYAEDGPESSGPQDDPLDLLPLNELADTEPAATQEDAASREAYYHLEADTLDDTVLACERADESKILALCELQDAQAEAEPEIPAPRSRASKS